MISLIAMFVSKSTVGLGTIIGSEIFNHLIISAASVMYVPSLPCPVAAASIATSTLFPCLVITAAFVPYP